MAFRFNGSMILSQCDSCDIYNEQDGLVVIRPDSREGIRFCRDCEPLLFEEQAQHDKDAWLRGDREADIRLGFTRVFNDHDHDVYPY